MVSFTRFDGLPSDVVTQVIEGENGIIYISTSSGICELLPSSSSEKGFVVGATYNSAMGYPIKEVNTGQNAMFKDSKGIIWIATQGKKTGLVRFDPSAVNRNPSPPTVMIQKIKVNEENICWYNLMPSDSATNSQQEIMTYGKLLSDEVRDSITKKFSGVQFDGIAKFYPLPENLILPYNHNHISFEFNAIEPARTFLVRYQYMLEGQDKEWSPVTSKTDVSFNNLFEGDYTFKVKTQFTRAGNNEWSKPVEYTFKVLPPWYRTVWAYTTYGALVIALVWLIVQLNSMRLIADKKRLQHRVNMATAEIRKQKEAVEEKSQKLNEALTDIKDSIVYAQRIQGALLTSNAYLKKHIKEYFIIYLPRDIVSGDFYWGLAKSGSFYLATADSTGHGVPGSFMSLLGISFLNEITVERNIEAPGAILNTLREEIIHRLNPDDRSSPAEAAPTREGREEIKDGMDMILCRYDYKTMTVEYAGANRNAIVWRNGKLEEYPGDAMPVGAGTAADIPFTSHKIILQKGDIIYTFTDGIHDQFGGPKNKKLGKKSFYDILRQYAHLPVEEQKKELESWFKEWKKNTEQLDDVLLIGVKI